MKKILLTILLFGVVFHGQAQVGYPYSEKVFNQSIDSLNKLRQKSYFNIAKLSETVDRSFFYEMQIPYIVKKINSSKSMELVFWTDSLFKIEKLSSKNDSLFKKCKADLQKSVEAYTRFIELFTNRYASNPICENFFLTNFKKNITDDEVTFDKYQKSNELPADSYSPVFARVKQTLSVLDAMKNIGK